MKRKSLLGSTAVSAAVFILGFQTAVAQQQAPATPPSQTPGSGGSGRPSTPGQGRPQQQQQQPNIFERERLQFPEMERPIYISGRVILDDGTPPQESVVIECVCNGQPRPQGYTDSKGRFSFQLGPNNSGVLMDASVSSNPMGGFGPNTGMPGSGRGISERDLAGCEIRAALPGYRSDVVSLAGRRVLDRPEIGTIILHRLGNVEGTTISMTSLQAPKDAKKAFEKGVNSLKRKKYADAQANLEKAVALYPEYAAAWTELGFAYQNQKKNEESKTAYGKAIEADPKFLKPYLQLAAIAAQEQKWPEVADVTTRLLRLDPFSFPQGYFLNAVANFNLQKYDAAEKSAREGIKLDPNHRIPRIYHLLGMILYNQEDYSGAAREMRAYLEFAPQAPDAGTVRAQIAEVEGILASQSRVP